jgi:hypothetical protein
MPCAASLAATQDRLKAMRVIVRAIQALEADPDRQQASALDEQRQMTQSTPKLP